MAAMLNWRWLETQTLARPFSLALARAGRSEARMAMIAITTSNSMSVKADFRDAWRTLRV